MACIGQLILTTFLMQSILGMEEQGLQLLNTQFEGCLCPGECLVYECTVIGKPDGTTVWTGSAFNCTNREISLFHSQYESTEGTYGQCDDIMGQSVITIFNTMDEFNSTGPTYYYTSRLSVPISSDKAEKSIECLYDDGITFITVGQAIIKFNTTIGPFEPLNRLYMSNADFVSRQLTFAWSPVAPDCPAIHYNILTSNCGSCPTATNHTTVTCTDVPTNGSMCAFAVQTVVCRNVTDQIGNPIRVSVNIAKTLVNVTILADSFRIPSVIVIAVLLLIITLAGIFLVLRFIKRFYTPKHSRQFKEGFQISQSTHREVDNDISTTIKTFDNIEMGNYSFSIENNHLQQNPTSEDKLVTLSNLLQKLKGQITSQWYQFGVKLGIPKDTLDQLNSYSDEDRIVEILDYWLRHHPGKPTWQEVAEAKKKAELDTEDNKGLLTNYMSSRDCNL